MHTRFYSLILFPMHMFVSWLWRKCLNGCCSKTDARFVVLASGGLFASEGVAKVVFFVDRVCPEFFKAPESGVKAFVHTNGGQLRCENTAGN